MKNRIRPPVKVDEQGRVIREPGVRAHRWRLNVPMSISGSEKQRLFFASEKEAKQKSEELLRHRIGVSRSKIQELAKRGMTVEQAIDYTLKHAPIISDLTMEMLLTKFAEDRVEEVGVGERYAATLNSYLTKIKKTFGPDRIQEVTKKRLREFLAGLKGRDGVSAASPDTRNHYLETFTAAFNFAIAEKLISQSPIEGVKKKKSDDEQISILSVEDAGKLVLVLAQPHHAEVAAAALLQLFAGPRRSELPHITWEVVTNRYLRLDKVKRGTKRRAVEMSANLLALLAPLRKTTGYVFAPADIEVDRECTHLEDRKEQKKAQAEAVRRLEDAYTARLDKAAKAAGIAVPKNALRHTAITMRVNKTDNLPATARWSGNSPTVIEESYLGNATAEDAEEFYSIGMVAAAAPN